MAKIFETEAVLVLDGVEHDVYLRATIYGDGSEPKGWFGSVGSGEDGLGWAFLNARFASIRLPDGREGHVVATGDDDPDTGMGFKGSGRPPA